MGDDERELARIAREAAEKAGTIVREAFGTAFLVESKSSPVDLVTEIDRRAEDLITEHLLDAVPDSAVLGEEHGARGADAGSVRWHIDPIDGTNNFVAGRAYFAVSIGIERAGRLVGGVVHDPIRRDTFWATSAQAWFGDAALPTATDYPGHTGLLTSQPFYGLVPGVEDAAPYLDLLRSFGAVNNPGSYALQIAEVAIGRASAALEITGAAPWDIAGGLALAQATGCTIVLLAEPTAGYGSWGAHSYLIARDPAVAATVAPRLRDLMERTTPPPQFQEFLARLER